MKTLGICIVFIGGMLFSVDAQEVKKIKVPARPAQSINTKTFKNQIKGQQMKPKAIQPSEKAILHRRQLPVCVPKRPTK